MKYRPMVPRGTWHDSDTLVRHLWYTRDVEPEPLPEPGEWGPLWTDNSRLEDRITGQQLLAQIGRVLTPRERVVLDLRLEGLQLSEIGRILDLSRERVRQVEAKALVKLRTWCASTPSLGFARPKGRAAATACA